MREDMAKVIVTTSRWGDKDSQRRRAYQKRFDPEEAPKRETMRPRHLAWEAKHHNLGEYLGPLKRYIESQVGRNWDTVYAEIRARIDRDNTVQAHILQHMFGYIEVQCYWKDGVLYSSSYYGPMSGSYSPSPVSPGQLYVCPKSGIIRRMKEKHHHYPKRAITERRVDELTSYKLIDGVWYWVRYEYYESEPTYYHPQPDGIYRPYNKPNHPGWPASSWRRKEKRIVEKRQLGKKEIKKLKLRAG